MWQFLKNKFFLVEVALPPFSPPLYSSVGHSFVGGMESGGSKFYMREAKRS